LHRKRKLYHICLLAIGISRLDVERVLTGRQACHLDGADVKAFQGFAQRAVIQTVFVGVSFSLFDLITQNADRERAGNRVRGKIFGDSLQERRDRADWKRFAVDLTRAAIGINVLEVNRVLAGVAARVMALRRGSIH
jgi:hypothetical protein